MASDTKGGQVDMELKKAFQEMQQKMVTTTQQVRLSDLQIEQLKRQITHTHLVEKEVGSLPREARTYEGVGRMFILQPIGVIEKNLTEKVQACEEKIKTIQERKTYLERNLKESEENLRELVTTKQREQSH